MKSILEFNLPEDQDELELALNAGSYKACLDDLDVFLRNLAKYKEAAEIRKLGLTPKGLDYLRSQIATIREKWGVL